MKKILEVLSGYPGLWLIIAAAMTAAFLDVWDNRPAATTARGGSAASGRRRTAWVSPVCRVLLVLLVVAAVGATVVRFLLVR